MEQEYVWPSRNIEHHLPFACVNNNRNWKPLIRNIVILIFGFSLNRISIWVIIITIRECHSFFKTESFPWFRWFCGIHWNQLKPETIRSDNLYIVFDLNRWIHCRHIKPNISNESPKTEWHQNSTKCLNEKA